MSEPQISVSPFPADNHVLLKVVISSPVSMISMYVLYNDESSKSTANWSKYDVSQQEMTSPLLKVPVPTNGSKKWFFIVVANYYDPESSSYRSIYSPRTDLVTLISAPPPLQLVAMDNVLDRDTENEDSFFKTVVFDHISENLSERIDGVNLLIQDTSSDLGKFRKIVLFKKEGVNNVFVLQSDSNFTQESLPQYECSALKNVQGKYELKLPIRNLDIAYAYEIAAVSFFKMLSSNISDTVLFIPDIVPYLRISQSPVSLELDYDIPSTKITFNLLAPGLPARGSTPEKLAIVIEKIDEDGNVIGTAEKGLLTQETPFSYYDNTTPSSGVSVSGDTKDLIDLGSGQPLVETGVQTKLRIYVANTHGRSKNHYDIVILLLKREPAPILKIKEIKADTGAISISWTTPPSSNDDISFWRIESIVENNSGATQFQQLPSIDILKEDAEFDLLGYFRTIGNLIADKKHYFKVIAYRRNEYNYINWAQPQFIRGEESNESFGVPFDTYGAPTLQISSHVDDCDKKAKLSITPASNLLRFIKIIRVEIVYTGSDESTGSLQIPYTAGSTDLSGIVISNLSNSVQYTFKAYVVTRLTAEATSNPIDNDTDGDDSDEKEHYPFARPSLDLEFNKSEEGVLEFVNNVIKGLNNSNIDNVVSSGILRLLYKQPAYQTDEDITVPATSGSANFSTLAKLLRLSVGNINFDKLVFVKAELTINNPNNPAEQIIINSDETVAVRSNPPYAVSEFDILARPNSGSNGGSLIKFRNPVFEGSELFNASDNLISSTLAYYEVKRYSMTNTDFQVVKTFQVNPSNTYEYEYLYLYSQEELISGEKIFFIVEAVYLVDVKVIRAVVIGEIAAFVLPEPPIIREIISKNLTTLEIELTEPVLASGTGDIAGYSVEFTGIDANGVTTIIEREILNADIESKPDSSSKLLTFTGLTPNVRYRATVKTLVTLSQIVNFITSSKSPSFPAIGHRYTLHSQGQLAVNDFRVSKNGFDITDTVTKDDFGALAEVSWSPLAAGTGDYQVEYVIQLVDLIGNKLPDTSDTIVTSNEGVTKKELTGLKFVSGLSYFKIFARILNINTSDATDYVSGEASYASSELYDNNPEAVQGVSAVAGNKEVTVSWTPISNSVRNIKVDKYLVHYWHESGSIDSNIFSEVSKDVSTVVIDGLTNGTEYKFVVLYKILDVLDVISSLNSYHIVSSVPFAAPGACVIEADILADGVKAVITITSESTSNGSDITKYNLYRRIVTEGTSSVFEFLANISKIALSYTDTAVSVNNNYEYQVRAACLSTNDGGEVEGGASNTVSKIIFVKYVISSSPLSFTNIDENSFSIQFPSIRELLERSENLSASTGLDHTSTKLKIFLIFGERTLTKEFSDGDMTSSVSTLDLREQLTFIAGFILGAVCVLKIELSAKNPNQQTEFVKSESNEQSFQPYGKPSFTTIDVANGINKIAIRAITDENTDYKYGLFKTFKSLIKQITYDVSGNPIYTLLEEQSSLIGSFSFTPTQEQKNVSRLFLFATTMLTSGNFDSGGSLPNADQISNSVLTMVSLEPTASPDIPVIISVAYNSSSNPHKAIIKVNTSFADITNLIIIFKLFEGSSFNQSDTELYVDYRYHVRFGGTMYGMENISDRTENSDDKFLGILTYSAPLLGFYSGQVRDFIVLAESANGLSRPYFSRSKTTNTLAHGISESSYFA